MPVVDYAEAREMVAKFQLWLDAVSKFLEEPTGTPPPDFYDTQKLSFEVDKSDLEAVMTKDRVVGVFCLEPDLSSLSVVLVGVDSDGKPDAAVKSRQTWPTLNNMDELQVVLDTYLTPQSDKDKE